jgi:N-acyl homoserine lactone hydrolase
VTLRASDVIRLHMGHFIAPGHRPFAGAAVVVDAFLIRHPRGPVLLDTGLGVGFAEVDAMYKPVRVPFDEVHFDHSGNNFRFPRVPILVQKVEREAVATAKYTLPGPVVEFDGARFELLEGEADIVPGVRIVPTPGHVPGHQSFVIDTQEGRIVIAGQAYQDAASYARDLYAWQLDREDHPHPDYAPWVARLQEFDPWRVTFAHDLAIWQREA